MIVKQKILPYKY